MKTTHRVRWLAMFALAAACTSESGESAAAPATAAAHAEPWQPHGLRKPTVHCQFAAPAVLDRSPSPMPDHIAEFHSSSSSVSVIVAERVEPTLAAARKSVVAYFKSGLLSTEGAVITTDTALAHQAATGHLLTVRWGPKTSGHVVSEALLAFAEEPIVEVLARYSEGDAEAAVAVTELLSAMRCKTPDPETATP